MRRDDVAHPRWCWVNGYGAWRCTCGAEERAARLMFDNLFCGVRLVVPLAAAAQAAEHRASQAEAALGEMTKERDAALNRLRFTHPVFNAASKGAAHVEPDDSFKPNGPVYRVVLDEDATRFREDHQTTARPPYIATVYNRDDACFFAWAFSNMENWLRHYNTLESTLAAALRELERWRHGQQIEGDYVCPDSLALAAALQAKDELADIAVDALGATTYGYDDKTPRTRITELRSVGKEKS
jgi:hypothetical protein